METFVVCDFETTGLTPENCEIISGCLILTDGEEILDEFTFEAQAHRWGKEADKASEVHRITRERNLLAPPFEESFPKIEEFCNKADTLICHAYPHNWGKVYLFDWAVLETAFHERDKRLCEIITRKWSTLAWYWELVQNGSLLEPPDYKLPTLCANQGIEIGNHHDAKDDTIMAYELFKRLRRIQEEPRVGYASMRLGGRRGTKQGSNSETLF